MNDVTIIGGATLVFINPDTDVGIEILRCWIGQTGSATSEQNLASMHTQVTAFPTLTGVAPIPHLLGELSRIISGGAGAVGTSGVDASAEGAGAKTVIKARPFNNIVGFEWIATPEEKIILRPNAASGFGLRIVSTPASLVNWSAGVTFREL
jgi:hypothetical protein